MTPSLVRIRPVSGWSAIHFSALWEFRDLLWALAARDVTLRYRQTVLGVLWVVLQPMLGAGIFAFVFGSVAKLDSGGQSYFLFSYSGLLLWNVFSGTLNRSATSLLTNAGLVSKIYFPRLLLPVSASCSVLLDFAVAFGVLIALLAFRGLAFGWEILTAPLWLGAALGLGLGIGLACGALAVKFRDVTHILPVIVPFWLYASPVAYATSAVPVSARTLFMLNPMAPLLDGFRWAVCGGTFPPSGPLIYAGCAIVTTLLAGALYFTRVEREFADVI